MRMPWGKQRAGSELWLTVAGERHRVDNTLQVGRSEKSDLRLTDPSVSRQHCRLVELDSGAWELENQSRHGTIVDGQRVEEMVLEGTGEIRAGGTTIQYEATQPQRCGFPRVGLVILVIASLVGGYLVHTYVGGPSTGDVVDAVEPLMGTVVEDGTDGRLSATRVTDGDSGLVLEAVGELEGFSLAAPPAARDAVWTDLSDELGTLYVNEDRGTVAASFDGADETRPNGWAFGTAGAVAFTSDLTGDRRPDSAEILVLGLTETDDGKQSVGVVATYLLHTSKAPPKGSREMSNGEHHGEVSAAAHSGNPASAIALGRMSESRGEDSSAILEAQGTAGDRGSQCGSSMNEFRSQVTENLDAALLGAEEAAQALANSKPIDDAIWTTVTRAVNLVRSLLVFLYNQGAVVGLLGSVGATLAGDLAMAVGALLSGALLGLKFSVWWNEWAVKRFTKGWEHFSDADEFMRVDDMLSARHSWSKAVLAIRISPTFRTQDLWGGVTIPGGCSKSGGLAQHTPMLVEPTGRHFVNGEDIDFLEFIAVGPACPDMPCRSVVILATPHGTWEFEAKHSDDGSFSGKSDSSSVKGPCVSNNHPLAFEDYYAFEVEVEGSMFGAKAVPFGRADEWPGPSTGQVSVTVHATAIDPRPMGGTVGDKSVEVTCEEEQTHHLKGEWSDG